MRQTGELAVRAHGAAGEMPRPSSSTSGRDAGGRAARHNLYMRNMQFGPRRPSPNQQDHLHPAARTIAQETTYASVGQPLRGADNAGPIRFHEWLGDLTILAPKTSRPSARPSSATWPSCSPSFKRNVKVIGLSVDPVDKHEKWATDIRRRRDTRRTFP